MNEMVNILRQNSNKRFSDEDGGSLTVEFNKGTSLEDISKFEIDHDTNIPGGLKELLLFSNGINLFGLQLVSLEEMDFFPNSGILSFHNWGNGDFDCISVGGDYAKGAVVFMSHNEDVTTLVSDSIVEWIEAAIFDIKKAGTLMHPMDYLEQKSKGLYSQNSHELEENMVDLNDVKALFRNPNLQQVETTIAEGLNCDLYKENMSLLIGLAKEEIDASRLSILDIERFIENQSEELIEFSQLLFGKKKPSSLSVGSAVTYSMYLIYLKQMDHTKLLHYLERRRISKPQTFLKQLLSIKKEMNI